MSISRIAQACKTVCWPFLLVSEQITFSITGAAVNLNMLITKEIVVISFLFIFSFACLPIMDLCMIFLHFLSLTSRRAYWEFEIQGQGVPWCPQYEIEGKNTSCIFYFSICKEVPEYCPARSGICLANKVSPDKTNITLYTRFINIGTSSDDFTSGRAEVQFNLL